MLLAFTIASNFSTNNKIVTVDHNWDLECKAFFVSFSPETKPIRVKFVIINVNMVEIQSSQQNVAF